MTKKIIFLITSILIISQTSFGRFEQRLSPFPCYYPSADNIFDQITFTERRLNELKNEKPEVVRQIQTISESLKAQLALVTSFQNDIRVYTILLERNQNEINRVHYTTRLLQDISQECSECLTLEELFNFIQIELPEEYWPILRPLKDYLLIRDEMVEAENRRLLTAIESFNSDTLINDLEEDILWLTGRVEEKRESLNQASSSIRLFEQSLSQNNERLESINNALKVRNNNLGELRYAIDHGQFAEALCGFEDFRASH